MKSLGECQVKRKPLASRLEAVCYVLKVFSTLLLCKFSSHPKKIMALQEDFEKAAQDITTLAERPSNDVLLELYSLYKQGSEGDVSGEAPSMMEFVERAKYNAWEALKGMPSEEAMEKYIACVQALKGDS